MNPTKLAVILMMQKDSTWTSSHAVGNLPSLRNPNWLFVCAWRATNNVNIWLKLAGNIPYV